MISNTLQCNMCQTVLHDNESTIKQHISSFHLNYRPYDCSTCNEKGNIFKAATEEDIDAHIATSHNAINSGYHATKDQTKEIELKAAIEECRRVSALQLSSAETTFDWHLYSALNRPADIDENVRMECDSKEVLRRVFISLGGTCTETGNISIEMKKENPEKSGNVVKSEIEIIQIDDGEEQTEEKEESGQTSHNAALEILQPYLEQNRNAPTIHQTPPKTMQDLLDRPPLNDCHATLLPVHDQPSNVNEESTKTQEVALNIHCHLISTNLYPTPTTSNIIENKSKINPANHFHGTIKEVQDSNVTRTSMITDQAIDNRSTISSEQIKVQFVVDSSASGDIKAPVTSAFHTGTIPNEIPPLQHSKGDNKQFRSNASKYRTVPQEPLQQERTPLKSRLRGQKRISYLGSVFNNSEDNQDLFVKSKRGRPTRTEHSLPRIQRSKSVLTFVETSEDLKRFGLEESDSEIDKETHINKTRKNQKAEYCQSKSGKKEYHENFDSDIQKDFVDNFSSPEVSQMFETHNVHRDNDDELQSAVGGGAKGGAETKQDQICDVDNEYSTERNYEQNKNPEDGQCESSNKVSVVPKSGNSRDSKHKKKQLHKCDQCAFSSTKSRELVTHRRFHESTNIHKCGQCPYITDKPRNLKRHMLRHTGQKPFQCEQCSYASIQKTHLKRHIRFHHP